MLDKLTSVVCRLFFAGAFVLFALGVMERLAFEAGYTLLIVGRFSGGRLLEIAVVLLVFVIAMQLRELKGELRKRNP